MKPASDSSINLIQARLLGLVKKIYKLQPWKIFKQIYGVYDSKSNTSIYCQNFISELNQGIIFYTGEQGLRDMYDYLKKYEKQMHSANIHGSLLTIDESGLTDFLEENPYWQVNLTSKHTATLVSLRHGYLPLYPQEEDIRLVCKALEACVLMTQMVQDTGIKNIFNSSQLKFIPIMNKNEDEKWQCTSVPTPAPPSLPVYPVNEMRLFPLKKNSIRKGCLQGQAVYGPMPIHEHGNDFFPLLVIWVETETEHIVHGEAKEPNKLAAHILADGLVQSIQETGIIPKKVVVAMESTKMILQPLATYMGFELQISKDTSLVDNILKNFIQSYFNDIDEDINLIGGDFTHEQMYSNEFIYEILNENEILMEEFEQWMQDSGLSRNTIKNYIRHTSSFINEFLAIEEEMDAIEGLEKLDSFFSFWYQENISSSPNMLNTCVTGLTKFYTFLLKQDYISSEEIVWLKEIIRKNKKKWLQFCA